MAITDFLAASDITSAINACKGEEAIFGGVILGYILKYLFLSQEDSFSPKMFFKTVGLSKKSPTEIERVFKILDQDKSGYIEQDELQLSFIQISHVYEYAHTLITEKDDTFCTLELRYWVSIRCSTFIYLYIYFVGC
uniref:Parvalbumin n=1 Tax=Seriola lalandi dorsalis TaxID=1841481 RepID=A0A3B4WWP2_SERLL